MRRREFLEKLGALGVLGISLGVAGCLGASTGNVAGDAATGAAGAGGKNATDPQNTYDSSLAGTCPRGKSCTVPQCQLWCDLNNDDRCDRGRI